MEAIVVLLSGCGHLSICHRLVRTFEGLLDVDLNVAFFCDELADDIFGVEVFKADPWTTAGADFLLICTLDGHQ